MTEPELTLEAKSAIRKYMLTLVAIPGIISGIVLFVVGFMVQDVAKSRAYNDAYREAASYIRGLSDETYAKSLKTKLQTEQITQKVTKHSKEIERIARELKSTEAEAKGIRDSLKTVKAFQESERLVEAVTDSLVSRKDFATRLLNYKADDMKKLYKSTNDLLSKIDLIEKDLSKEIDEIKKQLEDTQRGVEILAYRVSKIHPIPEWNEFPWQR